MTKQQLKEAAKRYEECYNKLFNALPLWKRLAIQEDVRDNKNSGILSDFVTSVITTAESEETSTPQTKSAGKHNTKQEKVETVKRY